MVEFLTAMFIWVFLLLLTTLLNRVFYGNCAGPARPERPPSQGPFDPDRQDCMCSLPSWEDD